MIGTSLGPYEILEQLGAGGMGEVWRARDARLDRDVAVKVLPPGVADDGDRRARFEREARAVAALNHPNIAQVYGLEKAEADGGGESAGADVIVMELVEGADLSERIAGRPLPIEDALPLALQIAQALEAAHEAGVVHRDLKPANVRVRPDEVVKVLDFGLAKIVEPEATDATLENSPTLTMRATQAGIILGTAAYMSPEQARGRPVDHRTDIWAFGCVLWELLSGRRAFDGEDVSMTLASVLKRDLDWSVLPESTPAPVRRLLERCLETDVRRRYQAIGDVRIEIEDWVEGGFAPADDEQRAATAATSSPLHRPLPLAAAAAILLVGGVLLGGQLAPAPEPAAATRFTIPADSLAPRVTLSPDGGTLVALGLDGGLLIRPRGSEDFRPLPGAEDAEQEAAFSPDGGEIAYFVEDRIRKISASGGNSVAVSTTSPGFRFCGSLTWGRYGDIVFQCSDSRGLWVVPAAGGQPRQLTDRKTEDEGMHGSPSFLPDGRAVLFSIGRSGGADQFELAAASLETGEQRRLGVMGVKPVYVEPGYVLFARDEAIWAAPFDAASLEFRGEPVPVLEGLTGTGQTFGGAPYTASPTGSIVYLSGSADRRPPLYPTVVDRAGAAIIGFPDETAARSVRFSPDDRRIAFTRRDNIMAVETDTVRVADLERRTAVRVADGVLVDWMPSGELSYLSTEGDAGSSLYRIPWDRARPPERVAELGAYIRLEITWLPNGDRFLFAGRPRQSPSPRGPRDLFVGSADGTFEPWLTTDGDETDPQLSPDGNWVAYGASEPGSSEGQIYVQPYPGPGGRTQVSVDGGVAARWSGDGRRIFFWSRGTMYEVEVDLGSAPEIGVPVRLFDIPDSEDLTGFYGYFDVSSDGERFALLAVPEDREHRVLHVAYDWLPELAAMFEDGR